MISSTYLNIIYRGIQRYIIFCFFTKRYLQFRIWIFI